MGKKFRDLVSDLSGVVDVCHSYQRLDGSLPNSRSFSKILRGKVAAGLVEYDVMPGRGIVTVSYFPRRGNDIKMPRSLVKMLDMMGQGYGKIAYSYGIGKKGEIYVDLRDGTVQLDSGTMSKDVRKLLGDYKMRIFGKMTA